jgi:GNAT superfamily N-acetyltransferase
LTESKKDPSLSPLITLRQATRKDYPFLPVVEKKAAAAFVAHGLPAICDMAEPLAHYLSLPEASSVFVAIDEKDTIVGFSVGLIVDGNGFLDEVSVVPFCTGKKTGRRLVAAVEAWAKSRECVYLALTTFRDVPFNAPFYQKLGFSVFEPGKDWPELRAIRKKEETRGLNLALRVCMRKKLVTAI